MGGSGYVGGMSRSRTTFRCNQCGWENLKWLGQCRECGEWGTLEEQTSVTPSKSTLRAAVAVSSTEAPAKAVSIRDVSVEEADPHPSDISEFDRVLGGGLVPGSVVLLAGEPGVGKSTLLLEVAARYAVQARWNDTGPVLYVTGEESAAQVTSRARRVGALESRLLLSTQNHVSKVLALVEEEAPSLLIVDSVQTMQSALADGAPGSVGQLKAVTSEIISVAKQKGIPAIVIGHVTKEGSIAGPRTLEHLVDVVCQFEGDPNTNLRLLRTLKNRYGSTDEVGCFTLEEDGIHEVPDPSTLFTSGARAAAPGSMLAVTIDGIRPMLTEVQALVTKGSGGSPRRAASGLAHSRMSMLLAVVQARVGLDLSQDEVYVSTVGGATLREPAADLAVCLAMVSAKLNAAPSTPAVALGEVGLTGEVRGCSRLNSRVSEAARLGWKTILIPESQKDEVKWNRDLNLVPVSTLKGAADWLFA